METKYNIRFWSKVEINAITDCWEWLASKTNGGYGRFGVDGSLYLAHRIAWEIVNGKIPEGKKVLHSCDNPACCNPYHLFLGTQDDNMKDMVMKNRQMKGEEVPNSKLTIDDVQEIRLLIDSGKSNSEIAREYNVNRATISKIGTRRLWKSV